MKAFTLNFDASRNNANRNRYNRVYNKYDEVTPAVDLEGGVSQAEGYHYQHNTNIVAQSGVKKTGIKKKS